MSARIVAPVGENGLCFDYRSMKEKLRLICAELDEYLLLPSKSKYLNISEDGEHLRLEFNGKFMHLLKEEVKILPVCNITVEELSHFFLGKIVNDGKFLSEYKIQEFEIRVSSGSLQWGSALWNYKVPN